MHNVLTSAKMMTTELLFNFQKEVVIRGSQIKRIGWVFDKLESTFLDSTHGHCGALSSCLLSTPNLLDFLLELFQIAFSLVGSNGPMSHP